jgi:hypothetical protein
MAAISSGVMPITPMVSTARNCLAVLGNGGGALGGAEGEGHVVDLGNLGLVGAREAVEHQQGNLGRHV